MVLQGPEKKNIGAVIVTYFPDAEFAERVVLVASQVDRVVVVDNNSDTATVSVLKDLATRLGITLILNEANLGVGAALNQGVEWLAERGYCWALTLDQDTILKEDMVESLCLTYANCREPAKVGSIGCNNFDSNTGMLRFKHPKLDKGLHEEVKVLITSGSLMSLEVFKKVGPFRNDFFIDGIDHEYCLRLLVNQYKVLLSLYPGMLHSLGAQRVHRFLWKRPIASNHKPFRHYYIARNRLVVAQRFIGAETDWVVRDLIDSFKNFVIVLLFEEDKLRKSYAVLLGTLHGLMGKTGKLKSRLLKA